VRPGAEAAFGQLCAASDVPAASIGRTGGSALEIAGCGSVPLAELAELHRSALPALFG
jgi:phosphoribosylformylglycinamidine synthase